jgi:hypothetical protein
MSTTGMGTNFGTAGVEGVVEVKVEITAVVKVEVTAVVAAGVLGNHTRTPISASMARWRSSNSKRVSTFGSSVMVRV